MSQDAELPMVERPSKRPSVKVISPGLVNLGHTCFANSSLQVLAASEPLHGVLSSTSGNPPPEGTLTTPFVRLMREIYGSQSDQSLNPRELYNTFVKKFPYFKPYTQQDAQEFLRFLLEGLKSEVPPPPNAADAAVRPTMKRTRRRTLVPAGTEEIGAPDSNALNESQGTYIDHVFGGKLGSYVVCDICKSISTSYEEFQDISLPIHDADSPHLRKRDRFRAQFLRPNNIFAAHKYSFSTSNVPSDQDDAGGMVSDVGGYISSGGAPESGHQTERRSFDEGSRKKIAPAVVKKLANLSLKDKDGTSAGPIALRLEPWGHIPEPPKERLEFLKKLLGESSEGHNRPPQVLDGERHRHRNSRPSSPTSSSLSRSASLSRTLSSTFRGDRHPVAKTSLLECFKRFTNVEVLDGDNKFACEECAKFLYPRRASKDNGELSDSDDDVPMQSPETLNPVAPVRKARRRTLTLEKQANRGRTRIRGERAKSHTETEYSDANDDEDEDIGPSAKDSSKTSLPNTGSEVSMTNSSLPTTASSGWIASSGPSPNASVPIFEVSDLSTAPSALAHKVSLSRLAPPRYILRKAYKRIKLQNPLPPVMILHLKRFYGTHTGSMKKLDDFVSFETEFDFAPFVFPTPKKGTMLYRLTGVVIHLGSINSGHYVSYFYTHKTLPLNSEGEKSKKKDLNPAPDNDLLSKREPGQSRREWVYASDTTVRAASVDEVLRARAYLLVYEKV